MVSNRFDPPPMDESGRPTCSVWKAPAPRHIAAVPIDGADRILRAGKLGGVREWDAMIYRIAELEEMHNAKSQEVVDYERSNRALNDQVNVLKGRLRRQAELVGRLKEVIRSAPNVPMPRDILSEYALWTLYPPTD